jgi:RHH-type proline utilization regulon transcriptional repressor/proline dehydrogenase/delta 1-pyrroline-5-carboxylate dehydrogenase
METIGQSMRETLEARTLELGKQLLAVARERKSAFWAREHWEERMLRRLMENPRFRVQALRFVDVLPALKDDEELVRHLREYFGDEELPLPGVARWGIEHSQGAVAAPLVAGAVRAAMHGLATRFIGGSNVKEALHSIEELRRDHMAFTLDLLGEATVSEAEALAYQQKYLDLLESLAPKVARWKPQPLLDGDAQHPSPRFNLSVKVSSLFSQLSPVDPEGSAAAVKERLRPILRSARDKGAFICLDMEQYDTKEIILRVFREILMEPEFRDWPHAGIAMQAYLRDTEADLRSLVGWARDRGTPVTVRLVRGAYWDYESVIARQHGWTVPVWTEKWETDASYERCLHLLLEGYPYVHTAVATHNVRSIALAMARTGELGRDQGFEFQMLYGMADPLKDAVAKMGYRVRVYVPFGDLIPGMAYLVRRLLENTASQSFLRMGFAEDVPAEVLLAPPAPLPGANGSERDGRSAGDGAIADAVSGNGRAPSNGNVAAAPRGNSGRSIRVSASARVFRTRKGRSGGPASVAPPLSPFRNEPVHRFTDPAERAAFQGAIERVRRELGREYPLWLHGRDLRTEEWIESTNPARPEELVGRVASANAKDAEAAVISANAAFPAWRDRSAAERAEFLFRAAARLRERRVGGLRGREDVARSGRGRHRSDRFPGVLRPGGDPTIAGTPTQRSGRGQRLLLRATRSGRGDPTVELPPRDPDGNALRHHRHGEHGHPEARVPNAGGRGEVDGDPPRD